MKEFDIYWPAHDCDGIEIVKHTEIELGSDFDFDDNGVMIKTEPVYYIEYSFLDEEIRYSDSCEIKQAADDMIYEALRVGLTAQDMVDELNESP